MEKICTCIKNIGVWHRFEKNETATMFFLKKPSLVLELAFKFFYRDNARKKNVSLNCLNRYV